MDSMDDGQFHSRRESSRRTTHALRVSVDCLAKYLLASPDTKASRFSTISVTMAPLNELTGEVMNTTMDEDSFGTLLMDDPGDDDLHAGLWWTDVDCAMRSYVHDYGG